MPTGEIIAPLATLTHLNGGSFGDRSGKQNRQIAICLGGPEGRLLASSSGLRGGARTFSVSVPHPLAIALLLTTIVP